MGEPLFSFGLITDCQYADIPDSNEFSDRRFRLSLSKLKEAIEVFNQQDLTFVVHLGDLIDQDIESFDTVLPICRCSKADFWHVLGNHDFVGVGYSHNIGARPVLNKLNLKSTYYSKTISNFRFIVLDTNEEGMIEAVEDSPEWKKGKSILEAYEKEGRINAKRWNGRISEKQHAWMLSEIKDAESKGQSIVLFSHHGLYPEHRENMLNDKEMLGELVQYKHVRAYINGHNHDGDYGQFGHLHCLTVHGMLDTDENAYALVDVYSDRLEVKGFGREPSRVLLFTDNGAI